MKKNYKLLAFCSLCSKRTCRNFLYLVVVLLAILPYNLTVGQTTVFYDDFNRASASLTSGGTPIMSYTTTTTGTGSAIIESTTATGTVPYLKINGSTAGKTYLTGPLATFAAPFSSTLTSNSGLVTWTFNMRANVAPTGFTGTTKYGCAIVLAASSTNLLTANGYAVVNLGSGFCLAKFTGGLSSANPTILVTGMSLASQKDWVSVKVTYNPSSATWSYYDRTDALSSGTPAWVDPATDPSGNPPVAPYALRGTSTDATYTTSSTPMTSFGYFWNYGGTSYNFFADNFKVTVNAPVTWTSGWPKAENAVTDGFTVKSNINVSKGTTYYVVLPNLAAAPTSAQVVAGLDGGGNSLSSNLKGSITNTLGVTEFTSGVSGLTSNTPYDVYCVAQDMAGNNLQATPTKVTVSTAAAAVAPIITTPTATSILSSSATLGGNITSDGGSAITKKGTVWNTTTGVTISDNVLAEGTTTTGVFTQSRTSLPAKSHIFYKAYATNAVGTTLTDESSFYTLALKPTSAVGSFAASTVSGSNTSLNLNWTAVDGVDGYLIVERVGATGAGTAPADGIGYSVNAVLGSGTVAAVILSGSATSQVISGLTAGTQYTYKIYPFGYDGTNAITFCYLAYATASLTPATATTTAATAPVITTPTATTFTSGGATLGGNITSDGGSAITEKGTVWNTTTGVLITDNKIAASGVTTGIFTQSRTSMPAKTQIFYKAYATNIAGTTLTDESSFYTTAVKPTTPVTAFAANIDAGSGTSLDLTWTAAAGADGYIILQRLGASAPGTAPTDGTSYSIGNTIGTGTVVAVIFSGTATSQVISGLTAGSQYTFRIYPFAYDGSNTQTISYIAFSSSSTATATPLVPASLNVTPTSINGINCVEGSGSSASQSFNVSGANLTGTGNISISGSTNFEVSADNVSFGPTALVPYTSSTLTSTPVYVRLKTGLSAGYYNSEIIACSGGGASATNVTCSGMIVPATPNTYTWTGATSTDWQVSGNWSPNRTTSFPNDILQFNSGGSVVATNLPTQTIAQLLISNSTAVEFQSAATATLTINGDAGNDLSVAAGSSLNIIQATNIITIALTTGTTGSISGSVTYNTAAHKLTAVDASAITFQNGATFTAGSTLSGNVFGTTALNSVVFASGSTYICQGGGNPFGASQPSSVVVFQTGSLYKHKTATAPSIGGRVYANFEFDLTSGVCSGTSAVILNLDNLTVTSGTLNFGLTTNGINIKGNISVASGATLNFNPATAGSVDIKGDLTIASGGSLNFNPAVTESVSFSGANSQSVNYSGTLINTAGTTIVISNSNGVNIPNLTLNAGSILNINAGKQLTVNTTLVNNGIINLLSTNAEGTATLVTPATISGSGTTTVQQYLSAGRNWYISSPVSGAKSDDVFNLVSPSTNKLYWYDEAHGTNAPWPTITDNETLTPMQGYVANMTAAGTVTFSGTLNTSKSIALQRTALQTKEGFNLVGNPYPAHITLTKSITDAASALNTIWYRTSTGYDSENSKFIYAFRTCLLYDNGSYLSTPLGTSTNIIAPMQAFWVFTNTTGTTLDFSNIVRSHQSSNPLKAPAQKNSTQQVLRLQVTNGNAISDETVLYFNSNASNSFDPYDAPKMFNNSASIAEIFTMAETQFLAINGLNTIPYDTEIPLGFSSLAAGTFSLNASQINNFEAGTKVILKDYNDMNNPVITDLSQGGEYTFNSTATVNNTSRFTLIFKAPLTSTETITVDKNNVWISTNSNNQLIINGIPKSGTSIDIFNAIGQKIVSRNLSSNDFSSQTPLKAGVYLVTIYQNAKKTTQKIILK